MEILHRDDLPWGGFAGVRERRLVTDRRLFGTHASAGAWDGIGKFVYLADAHFVPGGETGMHPHREVDVISVILEGRIAHGGSLEHGQELSGHDIQVQRAGGEGFTHNEVNPDDKPNRMLQLWVLPEKPGEPAGYHLYQPRRGNTTCIYGGPPDQHDTLPSHTVIAVALLKADQTAEVPGLFMAYLARGRGTAGGQDLKEGDLARGEDFHFVAGEDSHLITVHLQV